MKRWWLVIVVLGLSWPLRPLFALSQRTYLYRVDQTTSTARWLPGQAVPGTPALRRLTTPSTSGLTLRERLSVQPSRTYHALFVPNDPQFVYQWNLNALNVPAAWDADMTAPIYGGDPSIIVAVLDTGLALSEVGGLASVPDFNTTSLWTNTGEIAGDGIDNDGDGYIDDIHGWNFVGNTNTPADNQGHGTHVAQTIVEQMNNGLDSAGAAPNVTIMPLKVLDSAGNGTTESLVTGIAYAVAHGAAVINLSLGGTDDDPLLHSAIQDAVAHGVVVVAAAGNDGTSPINYPARYSEVISVGATQYDNTRASYSNYGSNLLVVAPGGNDTIDQNHDGQVDGILAQTCLTGSCTTFGPVLLTGTSQAAAQVSGVVALLRSCGVGSTSVASLLTSTATDLGAAGRDPTFGYGLVNAAAAMTTAGCGSAPPSAPNAIVARAGSATSLTLSSARPANANKPVFAWSGGGPTYRVTWQRGSAVVATVSQSASTYAPTLTSAGTYTLTVSSVDSIGRTSAAVNFVYHYQPTILTLGMNNAIRFLSSDLKVVKTTAVSGGFVNAAAGPLTTGTSNRIFRSFQPRGVALTMTDTNGRVQKKFLPFGSRFTGSLITAVARRADGTAVMVVATASRGAALAWYSSDGQLLGRTTVLEKNTQGLTLTVGDLNGDGNDEIIVGQRSGSRLFVYSLDRQQMLSLQPRGSRFTQGWVVATGDVDGDGLGEIIITPNIGTTKAKILILDHNGLETKSLSVTHSTLRTGVALETYDVNADGLADILVAPTRYDSTFRVVDTNGKTLKKVTPHLSDISSLNRL